jgi:hypothetical protein
MNAKIYKRVLELVNSTDQGELSGGMTQAIVYLQQFFNRPITADEFTTTDGFGIVRARKAVSK